MAGTPEEDLLAWLEREEEILGFADLDDALSDFSKAQKLFFDELGYDLHQSQFDALRQASVTRYEQMPAVAVSPSRFERKWGYQNIYRDVTTGRFISWETVQSRLKTYRGS